MKLITLEAHDFADLTRCFNEGFADYFVQFNANETYIRRRMQGARVRYDMSAGVVDGAGKLVGFWLSGLDSIRDVPTSHNAGTAIIPAYRSRGLAGRMYEFTRQKLEAEGIFRYTLEVIKENTRAIRAYEKMGYRIMRELKCLRAPLAPIPLPEGIEIRQTPSPNWQTYTTWWTSQPSWEHLPSAVEALGELAQTWEMWDHDTRVGYACLKPDTGHLLQLAIEPNHRRKGYGKLLAHFCGGMVESLRVNNLDWEDKGTLAFWDKMGMVHTVDQYEMEVG